MNVNEIIEAQAVDWLIRLRDARAEDWEAFTQWLEADPANSAAYDAVALADEDWAALAPPVSREADSPQEELAPRRSTSRRAFLGFGIAAAIAGLVGYGAMQPPTDTSYAVETGAGQRRSVDLADGSRIELNGATRIVLDRENPRFARLEQGEALFTVVHDSTRPFEVEAGDARLRDMGTVFNVLRADGALEVGVSEGAVLFNPGREAVNLTPGMTLRRDGSGPAQVERGGPAEIASWRQGRLIYAAAPLSRIAADLSRNLGVAVRASPQAAARSFTGVIQLDGGAEAVLRRTGAVAGVTPRRTGDGWTLTAGAGETP